MKCPSCGVLENKVIDSRLAQGGEVTRRRRECEGCGRRYTTYERVEEAIPLIVKKDGRRENYDRSKLLEGLRRACQKRPVSIDKLEAAAFGIERDLQELNEREVPSSAIGERVMAHLRELDQVAYVRFASVYRAFDDIGEFLDELQALTQRQRASERMRVAAPTSIPPGAGAHDEGRGSNGVRDDEGREAGRVSSEGVEPPVGER